jgi:hypothetical protein
LSERLNKERAMAKKELIKCPMGRPKKELQGTLLTSKVEPMKPQIKRLKILIQIDFSFFIGLLFMLL